MSSGNTATVAVLFTPLNNHAVDCYVWHRGFPSPRLFGNSPSSRVTSLIVSSVSNVGSVFLWLSLECGSRHFWRGHDILAGISAGCTDCGAARGCIAIVRLFRQCASASGQERWQHNQRHDDRLQPQAKDYAPAAISVTPSATYTGNPTSIQGRWAGGWSGPDNA
jgi:hypothetical protein